jgi:cytochrome c-type biogenesis protein CcmH/NrfG
MTNRSAAATILILFSAGLYIPTLQYGFVYDDKFQILANKWITDFKYIPDVFSSSVWSFDSGATSNIYRPLMHVIYMMEYYLFGLKPWGYHLVNILLHALNTVIVFFLSSHIFKNQQTTTKNKPDSAEIFECGRSGFSETLCKFSPAFFAALFFAAHPINTETVSWIGTLPELFMTALYLSSFFLYITCSPGFNLKYVFSLIFFLIAVLFKETAITLLLVILLYDYSKKSISSVLKGYKIYLPYLLIVAGYMVLRIHALGGVTVRKNLRMGIEQLILNFFPLFFQYSKKLLLPLDLKAIYVFHPVHSLTEWIVIVSIIFSLIFTISWYIAKKRDHTVFLSLTFIFIPLVPVFYLPAMRDTVFAERYLYLSSFGFALLFLHGFEKIHLCLNKKGFNYKITGRNITLLSLMILFAYTLGTERRQPVWKDDLSLWSDTVKKSPESYVAHNDLGVALAQHGKPKEAIASFSRAQQIKPDYAEAHNNMGITLFGMKKKEEAILHFSKALQIDPEFAKASYNLGFVLVTQGKLADAVSYFNKALQIKPNYPKAHYYLAITLEKQGNIKEALRHFQEELRLRPDWPPALKKLAWIFSTHENSIFRDANKAIKFAQYANQLSESKQPGNLDILAAAYAEAGRFNDAAQTAKLAITLAENNEQKKLAGEIKHRLSLYKTGRPFRDTKKNRLLSETSRDKPSSR